MSDFQREVGEWGEATFPQSTPASIAAHLLDEAVEAQEAVARAVWRESDALPDLMRERHRAEVAEEAADVYLLLLHLAHRYGFDLETEARNKMAINRMRTWTTDSGRGYVKHDEVTR